MSSDELKYFFEVDELGDFGVARVPASRGTPRRAVDDEDVASEQQQAESQANGNSSKERAAEPGTHSHIDENAADQSHDAGGKRVTDDNDHSFAKVRVGQHPSAVPQPSIILTESPAVAPNINVKSEQAPAARDAAATGKNSIPAREFTVSRGSVAAEDERPRTASAPAPTWKRHDLLSVHALGQFEFCSRSGIYSAEHADDTDFDEPAPRLDYLPNYDLELIEEQLSKYLRQVPLAVLGAVILVLTMAGGVALQRRGLFYGAFAAFALGLLWFMELVRKILVLSWRRLAAKRAARAEPSPTITTIQPVNWWSLLKAGFEAATYRRPFRHPELPLEGRPWRVLERGSQRIPVIKSDARKLGDARNTVYAKHELRLAAYAMLLEATEHIEVPYGVVLPADAHRGLAVPITPELRQRVVERLQSALELLHQSQSGVAEPRPPKQRKKCLKCRLGQPVPLSDAEISKARGAGDRLLVLQAGLGRTFHCACGDRFGSAPPHGQILQRGLAAKVE